MFLFCEFCNEFSTGPACLCYRWGNTENRHKPYPQIKSYLQLITTHKWKSRLLHCSLSGIKRISKGRPHIQQGMANTKQTLWLLVVLCLMLCQVFISNLTYHLHLYYGSNLLIYSNSCVFKCLCYCNYMCFGGFLVLFLLFVVSCYSNLYAFHFLIFFYLMIIL